MSHMQVNLIIIYFIINLIIIYFKILLYLYFFRHANDEFVIVANSFRYLQSHSKKLFFASVDFDEGSDVFQMVCKILYYYIHIL